MLAIFSLLIILCLSLIVTRVAAVALELTGLSRQSARFQARSAFSGAGFTTSESEQVVTHPVRRKVIMLLMLWGHVGFVTAVSSVVMSFAAFNATDWAHWMVLFGGVVGFFFLAISKPVQSAMTKLIARILRRYTDIESRDYAHLLHLTEQFGVRMVELHDEHHMVGQTISELRQKHQDIIILGIQRADGNYEGAPTPHTIVQPDDSLVVYGHIEHVRLICGQKPAGQTDH